MRAEPASARLDTPALLRYALASTGGIIGYTPLLTLLLPLKLTAFAPDARYALLAWCSVAGALAAGFANIAFGWLGDRSVALGGGRRGWMIAGLLATAASFAGIAVAHSGAAIVTAVIAFQVALNMLLAQVSALIAEEVPSTQKNTAAALLTLGAPLAAAASALVVSVAEHEGARLALVAGLMTAGVAPLLFRSPDRIASATSAEPDATHAPLALAVAWTTRLLVQIANSGVGLCLFLYLARVIGSAGDAPAIVARLLVIATMVPVPLALMLGRWSDRVGHRERFLAATAIVATAGLVGMAVLGRGTSIGWIPGGWIGAAACYVVFATGVSIFQALNIGHAMLLLPTSSGAGRSLGVLNLANTLPQVVAPLLALSVTANDFTTLFGVFAALTLAAALLPAFVAAPFSPSRTAPSYRG
ncbi:MFS transporter [Sphingomonas sp. Mn802worker]|uniref:MFS transporter n=1 Tax=Sphingomonas sp. Mn802worker TaxID=629773 RepID=UPI000375119C|nr:MFS transporter [Sphingomonas sp. Mn802worker]